MNNDPSPIFVSDPNLKRMKEDWNARARQNAKWFINTVKDRQSERDFDLTGRVEVNNLVCIDLPLITAGRDARALRLLEIGCGIGRMTRRLAEMFGEVYATDVSGEMIAQGRKRLRNCENVIFSETNGVDFSSFDDQFFDVILCAYVYQHMPTATVIRTNIVDAFRVLRPAGIFKFQTNSVTNEEYRSLPKDTWSGETFGERAIRTLAREVDAQMISISGTGTQHCWTVWRKRMPDSQGPEMILSAPEAMPELKPEPETDFIHGRRQSLLIAGLDGNAVDINNVIVKVGNSLIEPGYVGPSSDHGKLKPQVQIDFEIPNSEPAGPRSVTILLENGISSPTITFEVPALKTLVPRIILITNGKDGSLDVEPTGLKSHVRLFVDGISLWPDWEQLDVMVGKKRVRPTRISFVAGIGLHMVEFTIPEKTSGDILIALTLGDLCSKSMTLKVKSEPFVARLRRRMSESAVLNKIMKQVRDLRTR